MKKLILPIKRKWFDMILSGEKTEEYREVNPHYARLQNGGYTHLELRNGYGLKVPAIIVEIESIELGVGNPKWGAVENETYNVIKIGRLVDHINLKEDQIKFIRLF